VDKVRTVSDTKRDFYSHHTRPINSVYRRFVEELMVEMHLLSVNVDFSYDPIYALGCVTSFERFMQGYRPETDKVSIFAALCQAVGGDAEQYRRDAGEILTQSRETSLADLIEQASAATAGGKSDSHLPQVLVAIAANPNFKYSRLFAIGLYAISVEADPEIVKDAAKRNQALEKLSEVLHLPEDKLAKDLDLYRTNLDKMEQLLGVLEEALDAERKKQEKRQPEGKGTQTGTEELKN
jgi:photosystem II biogenesis protein Psp29